MIDGFRGEIYGVSSLQKSMIVESTHVHFDKTSFPMRRLSLRQQAFVDDGDDSTKRENPHANRSYIQPFEQGPVLTDESRSRQIHINAVGGAQKVTHINRAGSISTDILNTDYASNPRHIEALRESRYHRPERQVPTKLTINLLTRACNDDE